MDFLDEVCSRHTCLLLTMLVCDSKDIRGTRHTHPFSICRNSYLSSFSAIKSACMRHLRLCDTRLAANEAIAMLLM